MLKLETRYYDEKHGERNPYFKNLLFNSEQQGKRFEEEFNRLYSNTFPAAQLIVLAHEKEGKSRTHRKK